MPLRGSSVSGSRRLSIRGAAAVGHRRGAVLSSVRWQGDISATAAGGPDVNRATPRNWGSAAREVARRPAMTTHTAPRGQEPGSGGGLAAAPLLQGGPFWAQTGPTARRATGVRAEGRGRGRGIRARGPGFVGGAASHVPGSESFWARFRTKRAAPRQRRRFAPHNLWTKFKCTPGAPFAAGAAGFGGAVVEKS